MNRKILVFGNPLIEKDSIALKIAKVLQNSKNNGFAFEFVNSPEELQNYGSELLIMDAVKGLDRVQLLEGLDKIHLPPRITTHDFDLTFNLKLLQKIGKISKVQLIAIPPEMQLQYAIATVEKLLNELKGK